MKKINKEAIELFVINYVIASIIILLIYRNTDMVIIGYKFALAVPWALIKLYFQVNKESIRKINQKSLDIVMKQVNDIKNADVKGAFNRDFLKIMGLAILKICIGLVIIFGNLRAVL